MSTTFLSKALGKFGFELKGVQKRSSLENPGTPLSYPAEWLLDIFNGGRTDAGLRVSEMTALQVTTVYQCVTIIANGIAAHPLNVVERSVQGGRISKKIAYDHPLYELLAHEPNPEMTSTTLRRTIQCHKLLWGNGFAELERDKNTSEIIAIWPRNPARTRPVRLTSPATIEGTVYPVGTMCYETYDPLRDSQILEMDNNSQNYGYRRIVLAEDMLHFPGLSLDGRIGQDVVILARQAVGLALATEKYGAKFFGNGAIPQGVLGVPGDMTDVQWETLKRSWAESHGGENSHKTGVLPPGVTYTKTGSSPNEGQMIETRQHQRLEIASMFNVPGHMVGVNGDDAGKSSVEQSSIEFKLFCLDPHVVDWEQELKRKLFPTSGSGYISIRARNSKAKYHASFDMRKLMYPDAASRSTLYGSGKQWGYLCTNDIHDLEGMNPVEDGSGDKYWMPNNMVDASMAAAHSDAVTDGLNDGTLAATPAGTTPVGSHPVKKDEAKNQKAILDHNLQKHKMSTDASVKIAKSAGAKPDDENDDTPQPGKKSKKQKREDAVRVFSSMFRDAVGRASNRKKATVADYTTIFGPITSAISEQMFEQNVNAADFIKAHANDLFARRSGGWGENLDEAAADEFNRLLTAMLRN